MNKQYVVVDREKDFDLRSLSKLFWTKKEAMFHIKKSKAADKKAKRTTMEYKIKTITY